MTTTTSRLHDSEIRIGKILAMLSFATFLINGILVRNEFMVTAAGAFGLGALVVILPRWGNFPYHFKIMLGILMLGVFLVSYKALHYPVAYVFLATVPSFMAIALYMEAFPGSFQIRPILYLILGYVLFAFALGISPEGVVAGSRNQVSVILVSFGALALALESKKFDLILTVLLFVACVLSVGSTGILASALLVLASLFRQDQPVLKKALIFGAVMLTFVGFQIYFEYYAPADLGRKFSYERLTATDVRFQIIEEYIKRYTTGDFLWLGAPDNYDFYVFSDVSSGGIWAYVNSLHNSYLSIHAKLGVLAIPVYLVILHVVWCLRRNVYILILFVAMLVRAFGDSAFILDGHYNYSFYFFYLLASRFRAKSKDRRNGAVAAAPRWPALERYPGTATDSVALP